MYVVWANTTGISLNGYDVQLLDEHNQPMRFPSYDDAVSYLKAHGCTDEEIEAYNITEEVADV